MHPATLHDLDQIAARASAAASVWATTPPRERARALVAIADALTAHSAELVAIGSMETGLSEPRLSGELTRTAVQLRLFADTVLDGGYLDVRIDEPDPEFALGARPDLRRYLVPVGPVLNFAASNFPFAFSIAGGDTASALAAGCPVVVKAHSGHPRLSARTGEVVVAALTAAHAPEGTLQLVYGEDEGVTLLKDPRIAAASFTGSIRVGQLLARIAAARPQPIPFFGELGSVNPVFATAAAVTERAAQLAKGYVTSVSGSAGQLCTKPGFLFLPSGHGLTDLLADSASSVDEHRLLNSSITRGYRDRRTAILETAGVKVIAAGSLRVENEDQGWASPTIVSVPVSTLLGERDRLLDEAFGPLSIVVEYDDETNLAALCADLFAGNLTGTVHIATGEDTPALRQLLSALSSQVGRVIINGWPTGVAVTPAMQHGGPWPATTNDSSTSVGTASIGRFLRGVAYQDTPRALLPEPLRDDNPWGVVQHRSPAGSSRHWGSLVDA
ncbi:aldehyde dehydrogenase (NADP(+)) [Nostocoides sp. HKS02]|uniref:aldehyde dehydrogenase (NADP(+)) n=1 Tax=Nostocoides sp. HKS02 TaxID=1813880 RepID=UPI0012B4C816|nr:aldehyde dehydrogenase (NADP(+)) [Tetrasphaera sp. HKS02]QGN59563.1 aldehyde dehydrogenase family protein [Tetrasphaera sp. HKS02]